MIPHVTDLPRELTTHPNWVAWRTEQRDGKPTKVPYVLATGQRASNTNPVDWAIYPDPETMPESYDGVGFVFTADAKITGIDLDSCLLPDGGVKPWAAPYLALFSGTYSEISPSGNGVKIFASGTLHSQGTKAYIDADGNLTKTRVSDEAIEMYDRGRYFAVTGRKLGPLRVAESQQPISTVYEELLNLRREKPAEGVAGVPDQPLGPGSRHNYLLGFAGKLRNEGFDRDALIVSIQQLNNRVCSPPKPQREIHGIVDFVLAKPAKYRLTPQDFAASKGSGSPEDPDATGSGDPEYSDRQYQMQTATGEVVDLPVRQPEVTTDLLEYTEHLLTEAIASGKPERVLGVGTEPSDLILALAQAGSIKQHEARRRIKTAFKGAVPLPELDARVKAASDAQRSLEETKSPFILNSEGSIIPNVANAITMLQALPVQYNSFTRRSFMPAETPWETVGNWSDYDDVKAAEWCQRRHVNVPVETAAVAIETLARSRQPHINPVVEYLRALKWDGEPRIGGWLTQYLGAPDTHYVNSVARKWLISAVNRVMVPGCQADYTLVLEGTQGKRKSTALRVLGKDWFTDDVADIGKKDSAIQLQGKWIVEIAELDAFRRAEMTTVKAWLVRRDDHFRPPYGRRAEDFPRQNVFAASTNKDDWGNDDTGLRRFWPVKVGNIDIDGLKEMVDQLWAEAYACFQEGELPYLTNDAETTALVEQHDRQAKDAWKEMVEDWAAMPTTGSSMGTDIKSSRHIVYVPEILEYCLRIPGKDWNNTHKARVISILRLAGYTSRRVPRADAEPDGRRPEFWVRAQVDL